MVYMVQELCLDAKDRAHYLFNGYRNGKLFEGLVISDT
jgi:hypothetical protein